MAKHIQNSSPLSILSLYIHVLYDTFLSIFLMIIATTLPKLPNPHFNLYGKTAIVTGANSGIGLQISRELYRRGAHVYLACRNETKGKEAMKSILKSEIIDSKGIQINYNEDNDNDSGSGSVKLGKLEVLKLDTSDLSSVREFTGKWDGRGKIDILVNNAGIASTDEGGEYTDEGIELVYATNFLGCFLLTCLLEGELKNDARVVMTSSHGQASSKFSRDFGIQAVRGVTECGFHVGGWGVEFIPGIKLKVELKSNSSKYAQTKGMQVAFVKMLQRRWDRKAIGFADGKTLEGTRRTAHAFTPGFTYTPIFGKVGLSSFFNDLLFVVLRFTTVLATDVSEGAKTGVWLAGTNDRNVVGSGKGGSYWDRMIRRHSSADLLSESLMERLWKRWESDAGIEWH